MEFYIILRKSVLKIKLEVSSLKKVPMPPERLFDFQESRLPIGMGAFVINSDLYLTGGEKLMDGALLANKSNSSALLESSYGDGGLNSIVYWFRPDSSVHFTTEHKIKKMNKPKTNPRVAKVDGRVYILSCYPHCMRDDVFTYPAPFECYDPLTNMWEVLAEPPHFKTDPMSHDLTHFFVMGKRIYMRNRHGLQCYDVIAGEWYDDNSILIEFSHKLYSNMLDCVSVAEDEDNGFAIAYEYEKGLASYTLAIDRTIKGRVKLEKINATLPSLENCREGFLFHLGGGCFCFILSVIGLEESDWMVNVCLFEVKVGADPDVGDGPLETSLLCSQSYDLLSLVSSPEHKTIQDVVFMYVCFSIFPFE
ncbi:hypothetical protein LguiA_022620 [Lonicera macranthoides]